MIIGGSAGFRMMIALPCVAPPSTSTADAVVRVNSSMFARVPGPADFDATVATISAYSTGYDARHGVHHRDRGLTTARHHVDVHLVDVLRAG